MRLRGVNYDVGTAISSDYHSRPVWDLDVARAELAWWVARRVPGQNSPEQVGRLIAQEYALLYETSAENVGAAALLRAKAASMRDAQADRPDWPAIAQLLRASYDELLAALASANV